MISRRTQNYVGIKMLVLNGTKAFADLMQGLLVEAPSKTVAEDPASNMQWVLHTVKLKRKNCVVAMEVNTRYSMIFIDVKKADASQFIKRFIIRFVTEMSIMFDLPFEKLEFYMHALITKHPQTLICKRSDRSVQSHINDIVWHLSNQVEKMGALPNDVNELLNFGVFVNKLLRKTKGSKDYFHPYDRMHEYWGDLFPELKQVQE